MWPITPSINFDFFFLLLDPPLGDTVVAYTLYLNITLLTLVQATVFPGGVADLADLYP